MYKAPESDGGGANEDDDEEDAFPSLSGEGDGVPDGAVGIFRYIFAVNSPFSGSNGPISST